MIDADIMHEGIEKTRKKLNVLIFDLNDKGKLNEAEKGLLKKAEMLTHEAAYMEDRLMCICDTDTIDDYGGLAALRAITVWATDAKAVLGKDYFADGAIDEMQSFVDSGELEEMDRAELRYADRIHPRKVA